MRIVKGNIKLCIIDSPVPRSSSECPAESIQNLQTSLKEYNVFIEGLQKYSLSHSKEETIQIAQQYINSINYREKYNWECVVEGLIEDAHNLITTNFKAFESRIVLDVLDMSVRLADAFDRYSLSSKLKSQIVYVKASESAFDNLDRWNDCSEKPLKLFEVYGNHRSIMKNPGVRELARVFIEAYPKRARSYSDDNKEK